MSRTRIRYKTFTSFALSVLGLVAAGRLWSVAPPSANNFLPYLTLSILILAGFWRGVIYLRAGRPRVA